MAEPLQSKPWTWLVYAEQFRQETALMTGSLHAVKFKSEDRCCNLYGIMAMLEN